MSTDIEVNHYDDEPKTPKEPKKPNLTVDGWVMLFFLIFLVVSVVFGMICSVLPEVEIFKRLLLASLLPTGLMFFAGMVASS